MQFGWICCNAVQAGLRHRRAATGEKHTFAQHHCTCLAQLVQPCLLQSALGPLDSNLSGHLGGDILELLVLLVKLIILGEGGLQERAGRMYFSCGSGSTSAAGQSGAPKAARLTCWKWIFPVATSTTTPPIFMARWRWAWPRCGRRLLFSTAMMQENFQRLPQPFN